jgi:DNA-binding response OmpR family regulator
MLTSRAERSYVLKALSCGANEFLAKPTSTQALKDRLVCALQERPMVWIGEYYVPEPRALAGKRDQSPA